MDKSFKSAYIDGPAMLMAALTDTVKDNELANHGKREKILASKTPEVRNLDMGIFQNEG
jgi:hypothetical protein